MTGPETMVRQAGAAPACPMCGGASRVWVTAPDRNRRIGDRTFTLRECLSCGLGFVADPPADLGPYYTGDYHYRLSGADEIEPLLEPQRFKLDMLLPHKPGGTLLEIGPSIGIFCRLAQRAGFDVSAIEYDSACARYLSDALGVRTVQSGDPAAVLDAEGRSYDAICLWHSIEHLPEPWRVVEAAARHLNPGGVLLVAAPNPRCWQARLMKGQWPHFDLPRHLFQVDAGWLARLAKPLGLAPVFVTTRDPGGLYWNRFSWGMLAQRMLGALGRGAFLQRWLWRLGMIVGYALQPFEGREGNGAAFTAILRAPDSRT